MYGTLFAAMIKGSGSIITTQDEQGQAIPFLTTEEILKQLMKFGFYITYDVKSNLPSEILDFLTTIDNLGYDKITRIGVETWGSGGGKIVKPTVVVFKSCADNADLLVFDCKIGIRKFNQKLRDNTVMNVTDEPNMQWDWLTYMANISDLLDENIDPRDTYETQTGVVDNTDPSFYISPEDLAPEGFTIYTGEEEG